jgi:carbamoyl-phosphate synthase large subunit
VLGGRAMAIVYTRGEMEAYIHLAVEAARDAGTQAILVDEFLKDAIEVDVDCVSDGKRAVIGGVMQHIEEAGVHSGDSSSVLPPHSLSPEIVLSIEEQTRMLALELGVVGLMNVQFAVKGGEIYILEVNPRASRTVPFVSKATGRPLAKIAAKVMAGRTLDELGVTDIEVPRHVAVKQSVFPFAKFPGVDTILGPEMRSTGEVMGLDRDYAIAFAKSQLGSGTLVPREGTVFVSVRDADKAKIVEPTRRLERLGFEIVATSGTRRYLSERGIQCRRINKVLEGRPHIVDAIKNGGIQLVFNTTEGAQAIADSRSLRRAALHHKIPYYTTVAGAVAAAEGIEALRGGELEVRPLQSYFEASTENRAA